MARLSNTEIVARLKGDNRTVLAFPDQTDATKKVVVTDMGPTGVTHGLANASTATAPAYRAGVTEGSTQDKITVLAGGGPTQGTLDKTTLRTQYFILPGTYDSTKVGFGAKRCYVNIKGMPLKADGTPGSVADAVDAETTALGTRGQAVTNYAQVYKTVGRTPVPGVYDAPDVRQTSLYAPYPGYTVQHDMPPAPVKP